jgi:GNAT superfamily N-acetyltransferase
VVEVITARREHVRAIVGLWAELARYHEALGASRAQEEGAPEKREEFIEKELSQSDSSVLVAIDGREVVGYSFSFIAVYPPAFRLEKRGFISHLFVVEDYRRLGVGTMLVKRAREWFFERGIARIELRVASLNTAGRPFWGRQGFSEYETVMLLDKK